MAACILFAILLGVFGRLSSGTPLEYQPQIKESNIAQGAHIPRGSTKHTATLAVGKHVLLFVCGASIISPSYVVTAGHCIEPLLGWNRKVLSTSHVIIGTDKWNEGGLRLRIKDHHLHPDFDYVFIKKDIGLVKVFDQISPSDTVQIIAINYHWVDGGKATFTTGYDHTEVSQRQQIVDMTSLTPQQCVDGVFAAGGDKAPPLDSHIEICARSVCNGTTLCRGDGGSGLVLLKSYELIGVQSWGFLCEYCAPTMFTRLSSFKDFFLKYL